MKKYNYKYYLSLILLTTFLVISFAASAQQDTVFIKNFNTGDYKAASINYTGALGADGFYYFANENGILKYDGSRWELIPIKNFNAVYSMAIDSTGRIFVGGLAEIGYLDKIKGEYKYTSLSHLIEKPKDFNEFWQVVQNGKDVYYCSYQGLLHFNGKELHYIDHKQSQIFVIGRKVITSVFNGGMYLIEGDSVTPINKGPKLKNDAAYAFVATDEPNVYWMMTSEKGVYSFNIKTYELNKIELPSSEKLRKSGVYDAIVWRDSLYAVATWYDGLKLINKKGEIVKSINKGYGIQSNSLRELFQDQRGNIWVGTAYGISYLYWQSDYLKPGYTPKTVISKTNCKYTPDSIITSVEFNFATIGYDKSQLQYAYYLEGFDEKYSEWRDETKKEYTNLDGGKYTFQVKAKLPDGTETTPAINNFYIPTPWYKRAWVIGLFVLGATIVVVAGVRYRTARLKNLNKRLELIINDRTKELIQQKEQLKLANSELKIINSELDNFVYRSSHDLVAPLKSLKGLVHIARIDTEGQQDVHEYFDKMNNSILKLEEFIKSIMEYSTNTKSELAYQKVGLDTIIESIVSDLRFYNNADKIELIKSYNTNLTINTDIKRLNIILSNLITNCIKYHNFDQDQPYIEIKACNIGEEFQIEVIDNGLGIDEAHLQHIFNMFYRASENGEGSGLGLYIVKDTIDILSGKIDVKSKVGMGTTFTVIIPQP